MNQQNIRIIDGYEHIPYRPISYSESEMIKRSAEFYDQANSRRSLRYFSDTPIPREVLLNIIKTAGTAPSGANKQPWTFCLVSDPGIKRRIRLAAEKEEYESYHNRMSDEWLKDLKPMGTDWKKPFIETAPWIIVVFRKIYDLDSEGTKKNHYYVTESVGLSCGMLVMAIHNAGLCALTHTPSPMNFLSEILKRPENERPFLLIPVGHAAEDAIVPNIHRKGLDEICVVYD
jgi:nitroreductase